MREIGVNTWVWASPLTDANVTDLLRKVAAMGFDAVELPLENPGDLSAGVVPAALAETRLTPYVVGAMAPGRDLVDADPRTVESTQHYLRACIALASDLGARAVCGPFYAATGRVWRMDDAARVAAYGQLREALAPVVEEAADRGVTVGIEPLNRYETSLVNTVDQTLTALDGLLGPALGLALDTYHLNIEERSTAAAIRAADGRRPQRRAVLAPALGRPRRGWTFVSAGQTTCRGRTASAPSPRSGTTGRSRSSGRTPGWTGCRGRPRRWRGCARSTSCRPPPPSTRRSASSPRGTSRSRAGRRPRRAAPRAALRSVRRGRRTTPDRRRGRAGSPLPPPRRAR